MLSKFHKLIRNYRANNAGTASVETAIMVPLILAPVLFGTIDMGVAINSGQNLTSSTRAASQYLLQGGRNETNLKSVIVDSFEGTLAQSDIAIATTCACPNAAALSGDAGQGTPLPYSVRSTTLETVEQCSLTCSDGSTERVLVSLSIDYTTDGLYRDITLNKTVSVRIQ